MNGATLAPERLAELEASREALAALEKPWRDLARRAGGMLHLARALDVTPNTLRWWMRGEHDPHPPARARLAEIARHYGVDPPLSSTPDAA